MRYRSIGIGDFAANLTQNTSFAPDYDLDLLAGRHVVVLFAGTLQNQGGLDALDRLKQLSIFNGRDAVLLVVLCRGAEKHPAAAGLNSRGVGIVYDHDLKISRHFGAAPVDADSGADIRYRQIICTLNPRMQVGSVFGVKDIDQVVTYLAKLGDPRLFLGFEVFAPILVIPNVFEAALNSLLIEHYNKDARDITGSMRRRGSQTVEVIDTGHKVRRDYLVEDQGILDAVSSRIRTRVRPEIKKIHQFEVTRIERNLVGCYTAEDGGHFRPHRDNTTPATMHRKFALSVNLNDDFDGGEVCFPEYGTRSYRAPAGGAVVFSCSLLHSVTRVKRGARYAFLPFLYDAEGSRIRAENIDSYAGASFAAAPVPAKPNA